MPAQKEVLISEERRGNIPRDILNVLLENVRSRRFNIDEVRRFVDVAGQYPADFYAETSHNYLIDVINNRHYNMTALMEEFYYVKEDWAQDRHMNGGSRRKTRKRLKKRRKTRRKLF